MSPHLNLNDPGASGQRVLFEYDLPEKIIQNSFAGKFHLNMHFSDVVTDSCKY